MGLRYNGVILENPFIRDDWKRGVRVDSTQIDEVNIPDGVMPGVSPDIYNAYRQGRDSACVDIAIITKLSDGKPAILLSLRKKDVCFGGKWWIYGGALQAYTTVEDFITGRASKECGVSVKPEVLVGVYRTIAGDHIGSTLQPCYASRVPFEAIQAKMATDSNHENIRLFTLEELDAIPEWEHHWYPMRVARIALKSVPGYWA